MGRPSPRLDPRADGAPPSSSLRCPRPGVADDPIEREVALRGVLGTGSEHYRKAIALIAGSHRPLDRMVTHVLPLERLEHGIQLLAGDVPDERALAIVIEVS